MPNRPHSQFSVTWNQAIAFRLAQHHLARRAPAGKLLTVVRDMAGAQAQLLSAAQLSLWSRIRNLQVAHIAAALRQQTLVKASCMRRTLFLVPSDQLAIFVRGSARRAEKEVRWARGKGVPDRVLDRAIEAALAALDRPLTRPEIAERVCRKLGVQTRAIHGGGWGSRRKVAAVPVGDLTYPVVDLLNLAASRGVVCYGHNRGNEPTFVRADAWIPGWQDRTQEQAEEALLRKYLKAFGPATVADFAAWVGISLTEATRIWARLETGISMVDVEGWSAAVLREDLDRLAHARLENPQIRLLPYFDTFLLGHKQREHLVARQHQPKVYRAQGWIAPVILLDGRAVAIWKYALEGKRLQIQVTKFEPISKPVITGIREEAQDLARFLEIPEIELRMD